MINNNMRVGQRVMFSGAVVRQCGHEKTVADMRGVIIFSERANKNVVCVDTEGTYPNEEGNSIRYIPIKNLVVVDSGRVGLPGKFTGTPYTGYDDAMMRMGEPD